MKEIRITYQMEDEDGVVSEASIVLPMSFGIALDILAKGKDSPRYLLDVWDILTHLSEIQGCTFKEVCGFEDVTPPTDAEAIIKCRICGDTFTPDDIEGMREIGDPFHYENGALICPDCYDRFSHLTLEDQLHTLTEDW